MIKSLNGIFKFTQFLINPMRKQGIAIIFYGFLINKYTHISLKLSMIENTSVIFQVYFDGYFIKYFIY